MYSCIARSLAPRCSSIARLRTLTVFSPMTLMLVVMRVEEGSSRRPPPPAAEEEDDDPPPAPAPCWGSRVMLTESLKLRSSKSVAGVINGPWPSLLIPPPLLRLVPLITELKALLPPSLMVGSLSDAAAPEPKRAAAFDSRLICGGPLMVTLFEMTMLPYVLLMALTASES